MKIMLLNGPNLNLTGTREPNIYGRTGYEEMMEQVGRAAQSRGHEIACFQSNFEGALIDEIQRAWREHYDGHHHQSRRFYALFLRAARRACLRAHSGGGGASEQHPSARGVSPSLRYRIRLYRPNCRIWHAGLHFSHGRTCRKNRQKRRLKAQR